MRSIITIIMLIFLISPPSLLNSEINKKEIDRPDIINEEIDSGINVENAHPYLKGDELAIIYPKCSNPAIVEKGSTFTVIIENGGGLNCRASVEISTAYEPVVDEYRLNIISCDVENELTYLEVYVPENVNEELYNLTVTTANGFATEPRAVCIVDKIDGNFSFVHLTDFHIGDPRGMKVNIKETIGWKAARKCIEEINLIHPDFVIITGDLVFGQLYPFEYSFEYKKLYEILQEFDVPTYLCPGNHDLYIQAGQDGVKFWQRYFGSLYYSFDYGLAHFIMANSYDWPKKSRVGFSYVVFNWGGYIGDEQLNWIENDLKNCNAKLKCIALHHNPLWETKNDSLLGNEYYNRKELLKLIYEYGVDAVFAGHVHYDDVTIENETLFITTTTSSSGLERDAYWGYRLIEVRNWSIYSYNYKEPKYSIPSYRLNCTFVNEYKVRIENDLERDLNVLIEFVVPVDSYKAKNGEIVEIRSNGEKMQVYVRAKIEKNAEKEVYLL